MTTDVMIADDGFLDTLETMSRADNRGKRGLNTYSNAFLMDNRFGY